MLGSGVLARLWRSGQRPTALPVAEAYAKWAPTYPPHAHNPVMQAEEAIVRPLVSAMSAVRALDVGTGTGRNLVMLRAAGVHTIIGIDLSTPMLMHGTGPFTRVRGDALTLPFRSRTFDLVTSSLMCGDLASLAPFLAEASRVLMDDGHLVYSDFHPGWAKAKWRRTFVGADRRTYELPLYHHEIDDHLQWLDACGLEVRAIREPGVGQRRTPVVVVFHAVKRRGLVR
jgi:malonyl-CoA O-methyltransferase